jgi:hypothetical protein
MLSQVNATPATQVTVHFDANITQVQEAEEQVPIRDDDPIADEMQQAQQEQVVPLQ